MSSMAASDGTAGLSGCHRGHVTCKGRNIYCLPLTGTAANTPAVRGAGVEYRIVEFFFFLLFQHTKEGKKVFIKYPVTGRKQPRAATSELTFEV